MTYKHLFILILFLLLGASYWWWSSSRLKTVKNLPMKPFKELTVVAVGDSLVEGYGSTKGHDFVSDTSRTLGVPIQNFGVSGDTSAQVLARIDDVVATKPDVTILLVGGNDALQKIPKEQTFTTIGRIIQTLQSNGSAVVLIGIQGGLIGSSYQSEYDKLATEYETLYVPDILDGLIGNTEYMSDYIHPNDAGYKIVADKISLEMKKYLK